MMVTLVNSWGWWDYTSVMLVSTQGWLDYTRDSQESMKGLLGNSLGMLVNTLVKLGSIQVMMDCTKDWQVLRGKLGSTGDWLGNSQ